VRGVAYTVFGILFGLAAWCGPLPTGPAYAAAPYEGPPTIEILELTAHPAETSANKLAGAYTYPEVRFIDARLRVRLSGFSDARKLTVFLTVSENSRIYEKRKSKQNLTGGTFDLDFPEVLDLKDVFGEHRMKLYVELALSGAHDMKQVAFFQVKGRELPQVKLLAFRLYPGVSPYSEVANFVPGAGFSGELAFSIAQPGETEDMVRLRIHLLGVMEDEEGFAIDPESRYQPYDTYWDELTGPRQPGTYILAFRGYFPRYFYQSGVFQHPFAFHICFYAEDELIQHGVWRGDLLDYDPGEYRESDEEVLRTIQLDRARRWRLRPLPRDYDLEQELELGYAER